jgi:hypothetical protein
MNLKNCQYQIITKDPLHESVSSQTESPLITESKIKFDKGINPQVSNKNY